MGLSFCPSDAANKFNLVKNLNLFVRRLAWKAIFHTQKCIEADEALAFFQQSSTRKGDFRAIRDLVELLNENGGLDPNIKLDYNVGEFVETIYMIPESEPLPLRKKSDKLPQLQQFPHLLAFLQKVTGDINKLEFAIDPEYNLLPEQTNALMELKNMDTVVVKASDKGGNIVLMDNSYNERMCLDILRNVDWNRPVFKSYNAELHQKYHAIVKYY